MLSKKELLSIYEEMLYMRRFEEPKREKKQSGRLFLVEAAKTYL